MNIAAITVPPSEQSTLLMNNQSTSRSTTSCEPQPPSVLANAAADMKTTPPYEATVSGATDDGNGRPVFMLSHMRLFLGTPQSSRSPVPAINVIEGTPPSQLVAADLAHQSEQQLCQHCSNSSIASASLSMESLSDSALSLDSFVSDDAPPSPGAGVYALALSSTPLIVAHSGGGDGGGGADLSSATAWMRQPYLGEGTIEVLDEIEHQFWSDFVDAYLKVRLKGCAFDISMRSRSSAYVF